MSDPKRGSSSIPSVPRRAVVVGGGIAGLLAARVLCDHFDEVVLAERDVIQEGEPHRPGAPHAHHLHLLLRRGLMAIEQLFPGVGPDLEAAGSLLLDQGKDFHILYRSGWAPQKECGLQLRTFSRPLLEGTLRRHLARHSQVRFLEGCGVTGLVPDGKGTGVAGIRYCPAQRPDAAEQILTADLVVDASGRSSKAPEWLEDLGYPAPKEAVVDALWGYASRDYEPPAGFEADWKVLLMMNRPPDQPRAGILEWVEGNRWMVTVAGVMGERPPADEEGFLEFIRGMASPAIWEALRQARPLSRIYLHHRTQNRLRSFDRLERRPERFLALGDAVCAFTPVYGQGMTVSALEALELGECLRRRKGRLDGLAAVFQKRVARLVAGPWALATGEDLRWPATVGGEITPRVRFFHWYIDQVIQLIPGSPEVFRRFQEVNHMLKPATALFHPAVLGPVLRQALAAENGKGLLPRLLHLLDVLHLRPVRHHH